MSSGRGRKHFFPIYTTLTSVRNMLLGLDMVDQMDRSFVEVHFHKMTIKYSNQLVDRIMDREINIVLMKEGFLCDGKDEQEDGDNKSKKRDRDSSVSDIDGTSDQPKKEKLKKI